MNRWVGVMFLIGVAAAAALMFHAGFGLIARSLLSVHPSGLAIIIGLHLPVIVLMGLAWWSVGRDVRGASAIKYVAARLVRDSVSEALPFSQIGGFLSGLRFLTLLGSDYRGGALSMFADLTIEFTAKVPYIFAGVLSLGLLLPASSLLAYCLISAIIIASLLVVGLWKRNSITVVFSKLSVKVMGRWGSTQSAQELRLELRNFLSRRRALSGFAIHLGCWIFGAVEAWVTLRLMGIKAGFAEALVIDSLGTTLRTIGVFVPAAMGVQEAGYILVCAFFGIGSAEAIAFSFVRRARDIVIGLSGLAIWQFFEAHRAQRRCGQGAQSQ